MDRLDGMAAFAAAVETGSLSGAAKRLGCSLASVSRQISAIERHFGVTLLARTTRRLALTDEGRDYYEIDIAIVLGHLPDSSLVRRSLGQVRRVLCAAPDYLASRGMPATPQDLATHDCLIFTTTPGSATWTFQISGRRTEIEVPARLRSNALDVVVSAALGGSGIARAPSWQVQDHVDAGRLQLMLQDYERPSLPLQMIFSDPRHFSRKVQSFADFLAQQWNGDKR